MSVKELKEIYENGFILEFDDNDKIVFISDVHRGMEHIQTHSYQIEIFI